MSLRTPVFKTGAIAILPTLQTSKDRQSSDPMQRTSLPDLREWEEGVGIFEIPSTRSQRCNARGPAAGRSPLVTPGVNGGPLRWPVSSRLASRPRRRGSRDIGGVSHEQKLSAARVLNTVDTDYSSLVTNLCPVIFYAAPMTRGLCATHATRLRRCDRYLDESAVCLADLHALSLHMAT